VDRYSNYIKRFLDYRIDKAYVWSVVISRVLGGVLVHRGRVCDCVSYYTNFRRRVK